MWTRNAPPIAIFFFQNNIFPLKIMLIYDEPLWSGHLLVPGSLKVGCLMKVQLY